jgi:two-component system response regulator YesN
MQILIVDDDIVLVDEILEAVDWDALGATTVHKAYNILGAKKILQAEDIGIIVSDIEMPRGNGLDLLKWCRARQIDAEFLFLTCHEDFSYAASAIEYNASAYLTKPFNLAILDMTLKGQSKSRQKK